MATLPLLLPAVSRGFAALTATACAEGRRVAEVAAAAISDVVGARVAIDARPLPGPPVRSLGFARAALVMDGGHDGAIEIDAGLLARTLERLASRAPRTPVAIEGTDLERSFLALLSLVAIDAAGRASGVDALWPRVGLDVRDPAPGALTMALEIRVDDDRGRGQLVVPPAAVVLLGGTAAVEPTPAAAAVRLDASLRRGTASLAPHELEALAPGDVVLLDGGDAPATALVLPGGLTLLGRQQDSSLHVEEIQMTEPQAAYPLTLSVEIARVTITFGDLARLEPGAALPLDIRKDGAVALRAGDSVVARGQLVDVDGGLGVRIAQVGALP